MLRSEFGLAMEKDGLKPFTPIASVFISFRHVPADEQDKLLEYAREKYPNTYPHLLKIKMKDEEFGQATSGMKDRRTD